MHTEMIYGFFSGGDPRKFYPDGESCSAKELENHAAACKLWDEAEARGETPTPEACPSGWVYDADGKPLMHVLRAPYGIGTYEIEQSRCATRHERRKATVTFHYDPTPAMNTWPTQGPQEPHAPRVEPSAEPQGPEARCALARGSGSVSKRRWREYPKEQFSVADLPVWGYYPERTPSVRLIDFMGNEMTHWMPARDDIPEAPTVRQPTPNNQSSERGL